MSRLKNAFRTLYHRLLKRTGLPGRLLPSGAYYAQGLEDVYLMRIFNGKKQGFYVDVGANDGIFLSNTYKLGKLGWSGICIEPNPDAFAALGVNRAGATLVQAAIGDEPGVAKLFWSRDITEGASLLPSETDQKSCEVVIRRLNDILLENGAPRQFDVLSIDVEGMEMQVLASLDFTAFQPRIVIIEYNAQGAASDKSLRLMADLGYLPLHINRWNIIFSRVWEEDVLLAHKRQAWYSFDRPQ